MRSAPHVPCCLNPMVPHPHPTPQNPHRCLAALALRVWFAADAVNTPALIARLCDARAESGMMCQWRHAAVNALLATAVAAGAGEAGEVAPAHSAALSAALPQLRAAAAAGPYGEGAQGGAGGGAALREHIVASRPG